MRKYLAIVAVCLLASMLVTAAHAQCGALTPLDTLVGTWTFQLEGVANVTGSIGHFTATESIDPRAPGAGLQGLVAITQTTNSGLTGIVQGGQYQGKYTVAPDCSGGMITLGPDGLATTIGGSGNSYRAFQFYFANGFSELFLINTDDVLGVAVVGHAIRWIGPTGCPVLLANPLNILNLDFVASQATPTTWSYATEGTVVAFGSAGRFLAQSGFDPRAPSVLQGLVTGTETSVGARLVSGAGTGVTANAALTGKYTVLPDCSGGTIMLGPAGMSASARTYAFVFTNGLFNQMYLVSITGPGTSTAGGGLIVEIGTAKQFGPLAPDGIIR
jgi:hypothetical protein